MTQSDHPARCVRPHGPTRRNDSKRPGSIPRRSERRPYPTASTTTRVSPAKPGSTTTRIRSRDSARTSTPGTVWTADAGPIALNASWPTPIVRRIVAAFSAPGERVALLPWPAARPNSTERPGLGVVGADGVIEHAPGTEPDADLGDALAAVDDLDRGARVVRLDIEQHSTGAVSRPFWADLIGDPNDTNETAPAASAVGLEPSVAASPDLVASDTDLVITSLHPGRSGDHSGDLVALVAARLLRAGGIFAVITHSDWSAGELVDPTGAVVTAAQNADLLYLQHIVALHVPVRGGRLAAELIPDTDGSAAQQQARTAHRAKARGLPTPHRRIHSDVLVFAQPHGNEPLPASPAEQAHADGVIR
jgi:hypothetical protein